MCAALNDIISEIGSVLKKKPFSYTFPPHPACCRFARLRHARAGRRKGALWTSTKRARALLANMLSFSTAARKRAYTRLLTIKIDVALFT